MNLEKGPLTSASILVVDDEPANIALVESILYRNGLMNVRGTTDPLAFRTLFREERPDIVLVDLHMPGLDGLELIAEIDVLRREDEYLPVIVLSADTTMRAVHDALGAGATDFLAKPFDPTEVGLRIQRALETRQLHLRLDHERRTLDRQVQERTEALGRSHLESLRRLLLVNEFRDDETAEHTNRVGVASAHLLAAAGADPTLVRLVGAAAPLHDLGKVGVPDAILLKPGKLTPAEFAHVRMHPTIGARLIGETGSEVLQVAKVIAQTHHERWDGRGYPLGLRGADIPLVGRVVAVCDVFDALTQHRPYKGPWTVEDAVSELLAQRGQCFEPRLVDLFVSRVLGELPWVDDLVKPRERAECA
ncbi:MAG TPA: HD domain-containing phosphohydrolase [Acidimicrobiales bacterium]|nr:HD domain-containing phosphohydrolase [Acidimicrobiales bacterium]